MGVYLQIEEATLLQFYGIPAMSLNNPASSASPEADVPTTDTLKASSNLFPSAPSAAAKRRESMDITAASCQRFQYLKLDYELGPRLRVYLLVVAGLGSRPSNVSAHMLVECLSRRAWQESDDHDSRQQ